MLALRCGPPPARPAVQPALSAPAPPRGPRLQQRQRPRGPSSSSGNPLVYLDVGADGQPLGRVVLEVRPPDRTALDWAWGMVPEEPDSRPELCLVHWVTLLPAPGLWASVSPSLKKDHRTGSPGLPFWIFDQWRREEGACGGESSRSDRRLEGPPCWPAAEGLRDLTGWAPRPKLRGGCQGARGRGGGRREAHVVALAEGGAGPRPAPCYRAVGRAKVVLGRLPLPQQPGLAAASSSHQTDVA